jgi:transposase
MSRPLNARKPSAVELHRVHRWLEKALQPWQRRRAEVLLLHAAGLPASAMAQLLQVHVNTVYADLRDFARHGLSCLSRPRTVGAPPGLSREQIAAIWRLAGQPPTALGLPFGRWRLAKLRAYLIRQRVVKEISREHLRRVLKKGGIPCAASSASSSAPIPIGV